MRQVVKADPGFQQRHVGLDMLMRMAHGGDHVGARVGVADPPGAADVDADAVAADQVSIKGEDLVVAKDAGAAFLKPGVGTRASGQQPRQLRRPLRQAQEGSRGGCAWRRGERERRCA
jgi:hypothetical protein